VTGHYNSVGHSGRRRLQCRPSYFLKFAMTESVRLAKRVADLVSCSRREAEQYVEGGWVTVDGVVVEESRAPVLPSQTVALLPDATLTPVEPVTLLLHKPAGFDADAVLQLITVENLMAEDRSGKQFLKRHVARQTLTDRLENDASGLMVLTQDWRIVRKLVQDAPKVEYEYVVEVSGELAPEGLALLKHGLTFSGKPLPPIKVSWQNETHLRFALKTPPRGLIQHMCEKVGLTVVSMKRLRIGRLSLAGLPQGQWRYLLGYERF